MVMPSVPGPLVVVHAARLFAAASESDRGLPRAPPRPGTAVGLHRSPFCLAASASTRLENDREGMCPARQYVRGTFRSTRAASVREAGEGRRSVRLLTICRGPTQGKGHYSLQAG